MGCICGKFSLPPPPDYKAERRKRDNGHAKGGSTSTTARPTTQRDCRTHTSYKHAGVGLEKETQRVSGHSRKTSAGVDSGGAVGVRRRGGGGKEGERQREREKGAAREEKSKVRNASRRSVEKDIAKYESGDGWPKWLVDNIPRHVLDTLVPKSADSYEKLAKVGRGTYSNVYKARDKNTGKIVALKKVRFDTSDSESIKFMAREIVILQKLDHPNVLKLEGLAMSRMQYSLYLVFEFMQSDLNRIITRSGERLTEAQIKCYMKQLLSGLHYCHEKGVMHRDIKASNLLIDKSGMLIIADFGLANSFDIKPKGPLTNRVVTLWYRAPELLLGSTDYGVGIDLWSAGCLLVEMFLGRPFMPGRTEVEQLHMIFKLCGSPPEDYWRKLKLMTSYRPPQHYKPNYDLIFQDFPSSSRGLLLTLLNLDPAYRGSASSALQSEFFISSPLACDLSALPVIHRDEDERLQTKRRKRHRVSKRDQVSQTSTSQASQLGKIQTTEEPRGDSESSKKEKHKEQSKQRQETGNSTSSASSGPKLYANEGSTHISLSPIFFSSERKSPKTEGHPNALKNLQNYARLRGSKIDANMINPNEGSELQQFRRSFSDFQLDPEKGSNLYGLNKKDFVLIDYQNKIF